MGLDLINNNLLNTDPIDKNDFDQITVVANDETIRVILTNPIKYIPYNAEFYYDVTVDIIQESIWYDVYSNPSDYSGTHSTPFFKSTPESEQIIQLVIDSINQPHGLSAGEDRKSFLSNLDGYILIRDREDHYSIQVTSTYQESWYKINKSAGEIYDGGHAHLEPPPDDENDPFVEIL